MQQKSVKRQIIGFFTSSVDVHQMLLVFDSTATANALAVVENSEWNSEWTIFSKDLRKIL